MRTQIRAREAGRDIMPLATRHVGFKLTETRRNFFGEQLQKQLYELEAQILLGKQDVRTIETRKAFRGLSLEEQEQDT